jgi:hypothetical protein
MQTMSKGVYGYDSIHKDFFKLINLFSYEATAESMQLYLVLKITSLQYINARSFLKAIFVI